MWKTYSLPTGQWRIVIKHWQRLVKAVEMAKLVVYTILRHMINYTWDVLNILRLTT